MQYQVEKIIRRGLKLRIGSALQHMSRVIARASLFCGFCLSLLLCGNVWAASAQHAQHRVIIFVWDGLRPDSVDHRLTPNLFQLKKSGIYFADQHASYPTFTMMNAASFATGDYAGKTGFFGNVLWNPAAHGINSTGKTVDFRQPVFTEDYKILQDLNRPSVGDPLLQVKTLFQQAQKSGFKTVTVGKSGPAFLQDYLSKGIILDEAHVAPLSVARALQKAGYPLPANSPLAYPGKLVLAPNNADPTAFAPITTLQKAGSYPDSKVSDPSATNVSPPARSNAYLMRVYLEYLLPKENPDLSVIWLRNPDSTEHAYGPGSPSYYTALHSQDVLLGKLLRTLRKQASARPTDLVIVSDHAHSSVSGPLNLFPLRRLEHGHIGPIDQQHGYAVSGGVRPAYLLSLQGFHAYDGIGCQYAPGLAGLKANDSWVYPIKQDKEGHICKTKPGQLFTSADYVVPKKWPRDAIIVANNGGSVYFYLPSHATSLVKKLVRFLQSRQEFDAIFVDDRNGMIAGTLPMSWVHLLNDQHKNPDVIVGLSYDSKAKIQGMPGIEFNASNGNNDRGMHGSFSPIDVHNVMLAYGPDFKQHSIDVLPTGNVDLAPTIAHLLHLTLPAAQGRILFEALAGKTPRQSYAVFKQSIQPQKTAKHLAIFSSIDPKGRHPLAGRSQYSMTLQTKILKSGNKTWGYFDSAKAQRY